MDTHECPICNELFLLDIPSQQAVTLPCGHTACRSCLSGICSLKCPFCREDFLCSPATMRPSYMVHELIAAFAAVASEKNAGHSEQQEAIPSSVASITDRLQHFDCQSPHKDLAETADADPHETRQLPTRLQQGYLFQQTDERGPIRDMRSSQQQQQKTRQHVQQPQPAQMSVVSAIQAPDVPVLDPRTLAIANPWVHPLFQSNSKQSLTTAVSSKIEQVTCTTLGGLIQMINSRRVPTAFDLGGLVLIHSSTSRPLSTLTSSNITLRNGTIQFSDNNNLNALGLQIQGSNVWLEGLQLIGGRWGVKVLPGGSAHVVGCTLTGPKVGLMVGVHGVSDTDDGKLQHQQYSTTDGISSNVSKMEARNVICTECIGPGLLVGKGGQANVQACHFIHGQHCGMLVDGDWASMLRATEVWCSCNRGRGVCVMSDGRAMLQGCNLLHNVSGSLLAKGSNSVAKLICCTTDGGVSAVNGATLDK